MSSGPGSSAGLPADAEEPRPRTSRCGSRARPLSRPPKPGRSFLPQDNWETSVEVVSPGLGGPCAQHLRSQACGCQGSDSHSQLRASGRADGGHVVPAVLLRWLQPQRRGGEGPCLYGQPAWGGGWAAWQVQLRGGDHTDLGRGAPDIRVIKVPRSCELHLGYKSVLQTWSQVCVSM